MDMLADPELCLRALVVLFASLAGLRMIVVGVLQPTRRWSLVIGGALVAISLARELPRLL
jgi:hypothetical protein